MMHNRRPQFGAPSDGTECFAFLLAMLLPLKARYA
jgi:hypothetical protein